VVGYAMNASHSNIKPIPAHRVVNRNGMLTGKMHFPTPNAMQERLEAEGLVIKDDKIENFTKYYWDPAIELAL
jgi:methylated-DNA-protein-cysteine methyltransferase-like protein